MRRTPDRKAAPSAINGEMFQVWNGLPHNYPLLTVRDARRELKSSDQHVRNFIEAGKLIAFPINVDAANAQRHIYRIVRASSSAAFTFQTAAERLRAAHDVIRSVDAWLFSPFSSDPDLHVLPALRIGARQNLTVQEAAMALQCDGQTVRDLYDANLLAATNIASSQTGPRFLRLTRDSLTAFVTIRLCRQFEIEMP